MNPFAKLSFLISVISSGLLIYFLVYSQIGEEEMARDIERKVDSQVKEMSAWMATNRDPNTRTSFQVFLFGKEENLIFWTTHDYTPDFNEVNQLSGVLLRNDQGDFIVVKRLVRDTLFVAVTPIHRSYSISNSYLEDRYNEELVPGNVEISNDANSIPVRYEDETIFSIRCTGATFYDQDTNSLITTLLLLLGVSVLFLLFDLSVFIRRHFGQKIGLLAILLLLATFKVAVSLIQLPTSFSRMPIFEPETFSFRGFYPTLGDGLINVVLITLFLYFLVGSRLFKNEFERSKTRLIGAFVLLFASYASLYLFSDTINILLRNSDIELDITSSLAFSFERIAAYFLVLLLGLQFFIVHFVFYQSFNGIALSRREVIYFHLVGLACVIPFLLVSDILLYTIPVNALYLLGLYYFRLPDSLAALKFGSVNYLLLTCVLLSSTGAIMVYKGLERNESYKMQRFVSYLHVTRDVESEFLLSNIRDQIERDTVLINQIGNIGTNFYHLSERIKRQYFSNYFNNYEIEISYFDETGIGISGRHKGRYIDEVNRFNTRNFRKTAYPFIFYDPSRGENKRKRYICTISIKGLEKDRGFFEIELIRKKVSSKRVLPRLLVSGNNGNQSDMDYAIFHDGELSYSNGSFDYYSAFNESWLETKAIFTVGLDINGWNHLAAKSGNKIAVVSVKSYPLKNVVTNFSFLFMVLLLMAVLMFAFQLATNKEANSELYFSTKIMLYSVGSFALPLVLVAVAVLTTTDRSNKLEIDKSNLKKTFLLAENLDAPFEQLAERSITGEEFEQELSRLSSYSGMDINVFDHKGTLRYSSTPEIFENKILSNRLRPDIVSSIIEKRNESSTVNEQIGTFNFKSSYAAINAPNTGELLGVLQSPYFASKNHVRRQQLQVFGNIINIFTFIFIISIGMAYRIISRLTQPIMNIADRLHKTGFVSDNQPIEWKADDEIGALVSEYNSMLSKLEDTKQELARNEKEAAWREMAKQVAHEIKNPLTPMKLSIQHLARILDGKKEDKKSLEILLGQIDTLDEIVTSFSHFAKMPTPLNEPFDISDVLRKSIELHVDKKIQMNIPEVSLLINGDKKLFGRIFNNLILNAFESMKHLEKAELVVSLEVSQERIFITFKDFGKGIPEEIQDKVFIPNFSTKDSGTGIGLAVAKRGIEHAGGKIWFESQPDKGTRFFIELKQYGE